jgi:hypothetical protein
MLEFVVGAVYAVVFVAVVRLSGRWQFPVLAFAILAAALPYVAIGHSAQVESQLAFEWFGVALFGGLATLGVWRSRIYVAIAWAIHAGWDVVIPALTDTSYMPPWYAPICVGFDAVVALYAWAVIRGTLPERGFRRRASAGLQG